MIIDCNGLLFQPWIGTQYGEQSLFQIPVLVVGESNYGESRGSREEDAKFTHQLIENFISRTWNLRFFNNIQRCFVEEAYSIESRQKFWSSIAFYDYIQAWLPSHSMPPTEEMWTQAKPVFDSLISQLKPQCVLFVCKRLYYRVACHYPAETSFLVDGIKHDACLINGVLSTSIRHPSRNGFRNSRSCVRTLLKTVNGTTWV
ncbi:MAG: hypothetical protein SFY66_25185 [Oculatellaceae cyanobacterium bins.114]|nr:hypothetical protein [Oculatellaceae cyanobacterium bins.114]